jgi:glycerol kinase
MTVPRPDDANATYLAIDQGGHATRAVLFDASGVPVATRAVPIGTRRARPNRVEHDADEVAETVREAVRQVLAVPEADHASIRGVGLATQRSSVVCWDRESGAALTPVLSWQDLRGAALLADLEAHGRAVTARTGLPLSAHYGASKLRWCLDHVPAVADAARAGRLAWGPLSSFLVHRLVRERPHVVDPVNASRTLLTDLRSRGWSPELLELFGLPAAPLPRCVPNRYPFGTLEAAAGVELPLTVVTGDQSAALCGVGAPGTETIHVNAGTGAFLQRFVGAAPVVVPGLLASVAWQEGEHWEYTVEGTVNGAGSALAAIGGELGLDPTTAAAESATWPDEVGDPPLFMNGVGGLGSPFWRSDVVNRFDGAGDTRAKMAAVWESIAFLVQVNVDAMSVRDPAPLCLVVSGGVAASDGWCRRLAALSGLEVVRPVLAEATARGLAWLVAGRPAGWTLPAAPARFAPTEDVALRDRFERWRALMPTHTDPH